MLSLLPHLTTTLLKACLLLFLLPSTSGPPFTKKLQGMLKGKTKTKPQFEEIEPTSEPGSDMARMLELSDQEFKKLDNMKEQMDNVSREPEILRRNLKILKIKNTITEIKNAFDGVITRPDTVRKEFALEDMVIETSKTGTMAGKKRVQNI